MPGHVRPAPEKVLVFGASGHVGGPLVETIQARNNPPQLRLVTSSQDKVAGLGKRFPGAETVVADFTDLPSLVDAFDDIDAAFLISPDFQYNERQVASNLAAAAWHSGNEPHLVKLAGLGIGVNHVNELRTAMREGRGPALAYSQWRAVLNASGLPVSFLSSWGYFMDDLLTVWLLPMMTRQVFSAAFDRSTTFLDPRDLGAAAAAMLLAPHDRDHDGFVHYCTGTERIRFSEVALLLSEILGVEIAYEDDPDRWANEVRDVCDAKFGTGATDYLVKFFENEQRDEPLFIVTDVLPNLLGRPAKTLREWIEEHKHAFLAEGSPLHELATTTV
ncbi:NmrA family NAD(P)-binding protein [Mycobacterium novum]